MEHFYKQFIREKQYLHNVSPRTVEGYQWAWKAFEPALAGRSCVTKYEILQRVEELRARGLFGITAVAVLLLAIGVHNAWDSVSYHVFESEPDEHE